MGEIAANPLYAILLLVFASAFAALLLDLLLFAILQRLLEHSNSALARSVKKRCHVAVGWLLFLVVIRLALPALCVPESTDASARHIISLFMIAVISWLIIKTVYVLEDYVLSRFDIAEKDNLRARKVYTQFKVLKRITIIVAVILAAALMLMTFPNIRQVGTTILASAGVIGLVIGMAAQRTIGAFIAGLQIAFTQPIRLDDVVIVENEWGRIEEIALTFVVVKIWDLRRLVVPITYFIEKPFQNWTRTTADILGTVFIYVDYTVPIEAVRAELKKIVEQSQLWDKKVCVLQVTGTTERAVELRALVSAADASTAWSLRCEVREKLIGFLQKNYPDALPKIRAELKETRS